MEIDTDILLYFSKTALSPIHKVDRITNAAVRNKVDKFLNNLPKSEYNEILDSKKWKCHYQENFTEDKAKEIWLKYKLIRSIDELRISKLKHQSDSKEITPYNLNLFDNIEIDKNQLIDISPIHIENPLPSQTFIIADMKFAICQSIGGTNSSYWLAHCLKSLIHSGHTVYARFDPLMYNSIASFDDMEYRMQVWGKDLDWNKLSNIRRPEHGQWIPDMLECSSSIRTDYVWKPTGKEIHFTMEELPTQESIETRGSRYLHAIFNISMNVFVHCDGATRIYNKDEISKRLTFHLKESEVIKIGVRVKIFDIKSELTIGEFISVACNYFVWNYDVIDYLTNSKKEEP